MPGLRDVPSLDPDRTRSPIVLLLDLLGGFSTPLDTVPSATTAEGVLLILPRAIRPPILSSAAAAVCGSTVAGLHDRQRRQWDTIERRISAELAATRSALDASGSTCEVIEARFARSSLPHRHVHQAALAVTDVIRSIEVMRVVVEASNPLLPAVERLGRRGSPLEIVRVSSTPTRCSGPVHRHAPRPDTVFAPA